MAPRSRISLHEAARRLDVHYMTVYRYVRTGRLPAERDGANWTIDPADLERMRAPGPARRGAGAIRSEGSAQLVRRMVAGDEAGAWNTVEAALASSLEPADVYHELLVPALRDIGAGWEDGSLSIADEHGATAVAQRIIGRLGPRFARRGRKRGAVVLGAPPGDEHGLPSAIVADLLRAARFEALDLGANVPAESFVDAARDANRLVAVLIGATTPGRDQSVRASIRALRAAGVDVPVLVGGGAIDDDAHARRLGADGRTGPDAQSAVTAVERVASTPHVRSSGAARA
jgi:excisionase family DNA binding protein